VPGAIANGSPRAAMASAAAARCSMLNASRAASAVARNVAFSPEARGLDIHHRHGPPWFETRGVAALLTMRTSS